MKRSSIFGLIFIFFLTLPTLASAGVTYLPGPTNNETFQPDTSYSYTLPESMDNKCSSIDCKYTTNLDDKIGYCSFGRGQEMLLEITITNGSSNTYTINVSTWEFSPSEISITIGSTLIFNVIDNSSIHNIVLPWETPIITEDVKETPGFEFNITTLAILFAFIFLKRK
jgi:hypothetical protein